VTATVVTVEQYDPSWPERFREQADHLERALGPLIVALEHIGSTAIPGLPAKPIIDLAACAASGIDPFSLGHAISQLEYVQHREGPKTHAVYVRGTAVARTEILHVFSAGAWTNCNQRVFRDKLLHDRIARQRYAELKTRLATDGLVGADYTAAKRGLIEELLNEERVSRGLPVTTAWDK
jgi:GrpB-like predicted nucleotidyltransferase (UPF0157 family)